MDEQRLYNIQHALQQEGQPGQQGVDGWLFCDFRGSDPLAYRILGLDLAAISTRRWYYFIPAHGEPVSIVSSVEPRRLDTLPGRKRVFLSWQQLHESLAETLQGVRRVAMQYSPGNAIPYISRVDAGTIELIRQLGIEVVSSADLVQCFEAVWTPSQWQSHLRAATGVRETVDEAFAYIRQHAPVTEYAVQQFILERFAARGLTTHHPPIVAINAHSADPHFEPTPQDATPIRPGDFVLIDLWAKEPSGVYADFTWTGFMGSRIPERYQEIFTIVRIATGERPAPELPDPFAPLPVCSPGTLTGINGLPSYETPAGYPLQIDWDGVLVDDQDHPDDIVSRVREVLEVIWEE